MIQTIGKTLALLGPWFAFAFCVPANAQQVAAVACSNATLRGNFAVVISGQSGVPSAPVPRVGVSMTRFDGVGNVFDLDHIVGNGEQPTDDWRTGTGTYTVNADCTGKFQVNFGAGPPLVLYFVVGRVGNTFRGVVGAPGASITADGVKLESL